MGCQSTARLPPALNSPVPICTPGWREVLWELSVLPKNTTQRPRSGLEPRPLDLETNALTMRLPHLPIQRIPTELLVRSCMMEHFIYGPYIDRYMRFANRILLVYKGKCRNLIGWTTLLSADVRVQRLEFGNDFWIPAFLCDFKTLKFLQPMITRAQLQFLKIRGILLKDEV